MSPEPSGGLVNSAAPTPTLPGNSQPAELAEAVSRATGSTLQPASGSRVVPPPPPGRTTAPSSAGAPTAPKDRSLGSVTQDAQGPAAVETVDADSDTPAPVMSATRRMRSRLTR